MMEMAKKRTPVVDWSWEARKGESPRMDKQSPLQFFLRLFDVRDRQSVHDPVLCAAEWSLSECLGSFLFH